MAIFATTSYVSREPRVRRARCGRSARWFEDVLADGQYCNVRFGAGALGAFMTGWARLGHAPVSPRGCALGSGGWL